MWRGGPRGRPALILATPSLEERFPVAITLVSKSVHIGRVPMGQNGRVFCWAEFAFSTTDASGTIQCPLRTCDLVMLTLAAAPNTDEDIYVSEAANTTN